ncbi:MAG: ACP S-malonyltransferase [Pirellulaceae bacterium]
MANNAFLFPGQGAQSVGMGQQLCEQLPAARELFDRANDILGYDLANICFAGPKETLDATEHSQPALLVTSMAALEWLKQHDPEQIDQCSVAAGLSLGEYTAMVFADALSFEDGLKLVRERGLAMQAAADAQASGMVSVLGLESDKVAELCDAARQPNEILQIANYLCPGNIVVSGHVASCEKVAEVAEQFGAMRAIPLAVAGAFHTAIMQPAEERLAAALDAVEISPPRIPVVSNVDAEAHNDPNDIRQILVRQVCSPVQWHESMNQLLEQAVDLFFEVGNGRVLRGLMKRINRKAKCSGVPE